MLMLFHTLSNMICAGKSRSRKHSPVLDRLTILLVLDDTLLDADGAALGLVGAVAHLLVLGLCHGAALALVFLSAVGSEGGVALGVGHGLALLVLLHTADLKDMKKIKRLFMSRTTVIIIAFKVSQVCEKGH